MVWQRSYREVHRRGPGVLARLAGARLTVVVGRAMVVALAALLWLAARPARAETVTEVWRSPSPDLNPWSVAVNPKDGSCWVAELGLGSVDTPLMGRVVHFSSTGGELWRSPAGEFLGPEAVAVNSADGSCWVADTAHLQVVHLSSTGAELWRSAKSISGYGATSLSVNPTDDSCWTAGDYAVHLASDGKELWRSQWGAQCVSVNPADGSCWVAEGAYLVHVAADGTQLWKSPDFAFVDPSCLAASPTDGSCWVVDGGLLVHVSSAGDKLWSSNYGVLVASVDPVDGSCWGALTSYQVVHFSSAGVELWRSPSGEFYQPQAVSLDPADGSCWVADIGWNRDGDAGLPQIVHLSAAGVEVGRSTDNLFSAPIAVSANLNGSSCWVADPGLPLGGAPHMGAEVVHLSAADEVLWRSPLGGFPNPTAVSVNQADDSCWVAEGGVPVVSGRQDATHLSPSGTELWQSPAGQFTALSSISVNYADYSWWVATTSQVVHLSAVQTELWRSSATEFEEPASVSVNPMDGSCWVADNGGMTVVHLSAAGTELWRSPEGVYASPYSVSVNSVDGSCWVAMGSSWSGAQVVHLSATGKELWHSAEGEFDPWTLSVSVNAADGSCWVADTGHDQVVHLSAEGKELWRSPAGEFAMPEAVSANAWDGACWVADTGDGQVVHLVLGGLYATLTTDAPSPAPGALVTYTFNCRDLVTTGPAEAAVLTDVLDPGLAFVSAAGGGSYDAGTRTVTWSLGALPVGGSATVSLTTRVSASAALGSWITTYGTLSAAGQPAVTSNLVRQTISQTAAPVADFSGTPVSGEAPLLVQFTDQSTGSPTAWSWSFGDGGASTSRNPSYTYQKAGDYTVSLTASNAGGSDTKTKSDYLHALFSDVAPDFWASSQVMACVDAGIVTGYPGDLYAPSLEVTRDQMAVYIARALAGGDAKVPTAPATASFTDVPTDYWAFRYVEYAKSRGVVSGYTATQYMPTLPVTRDQMSVFVARSIVNPTGDGGLVSYTPPTAPDFPDVATDFWAYKYIEYIKGQSITGGYPDGKYHPEIVVTRDQMAVYIARAFKLQ